MLYCHCYFSLSKGAVMDNRSGHHKKNLSGDSAYYSFVPSSLPPVPAIELDQEGLSLLIEANKHLANLQSASVYVPDVGQFVGMYVRKEALLSSQIEGTQATLEDVLDPSLNVNTNRSAAEVINYIRAIEFAIERMKQLPLCNRLIRETHEVLMKDVRGQERQPGEFRTSQNWIGGLGSTLSNAVYIPPSPEDMLTAMFELEEYLHSEDQTNVLIRAALVHYQFETIHPFLDGNGRIGRLLITLFLIAQNALTSPVLYISYYLKQNRVEYYDRMMEVRQKGNYEQWVSFFLRAVCETAKDAIQTIQQLADLHAENINRVLKMDRAAKNAVRLLAYLEINPIIDIGKTAKALDLSYNTVSSAVNRFVDAGILVSTTSAARNRAFAYEAYLTILRKGT